MLLFDEVLYLKVMVVNNLIRKHNMLPKDLIQIAKEKDLLEYLTIAYDMLQSTGTDGIMEDVEEYLGIV